jgi:hypothetical protein
MCHFFSSRILKKVGIAALKNEVKEMIELNNRLLARTNNFRDQLISLKEDPIL